MAITEKQTGYKQKHYYYIPEQFKNLSANPYYHASLYVASKQ